MQSVQIVVRNKSGLHARPAALFVQTAARFASRVTLENLYRNGHPVDAKSILMVLTTGVAQGHRIRIAADGPDEEAAIVELESAVSSGLGEPVEETPSAAS